MCGSDQETPGTGLGDWEAPRPYATGGITSFHSVAAAVASRMTVMIKRYIAAASDRRALSTVQAARAHWVMRVKIDMPTV
ncbi:hypothetical protein SAMN04489732_14230 [Amycolatopsis saalfeldensis]|uniref:Uncharacterized protein n=1 Tax=Amycolatopsis saalfeldensis TaxID=394193 RepID=A0A1H8YQ47_9PSEU|nr:hypothetical protein SAMN04489732_14230 [Amycolatopsis saalfeldensis]